MRFGRPDWWAFVSRRVSYLEGLGGIINSDSDPELWEGRSATSAGGLPGIRGRCIQGYGDRTTLTATMDGVTQFDGQSSLT